MRGCRLGVERTQLGLRVLGEERVNPVPAAALQPNDEEVRVLQLVEQLPRVAPLERVVA